MQLLGTEAICSGRLECGKITILNCFCSFRRLLWIVKNDLMNVALIETVEFRFSVKKLLHKDFFLNIYMYHLKIAEVALRSFSVPSECP